MFHVFTSCAVRWPQVRAEHGRSFFLVFPLFFFSVWLSVFLAPCIHPPNWPILSAPRSDYLNSHLILGWSSHCSAISHSTFNLFTFRHTSESSSHPPTRPTTFLSFRSLCYQLSSSTKVASANSTLYTQVGPSPTSAPSPHIRLTEGFHTASRPSIRRIARKHPCS